MTVSSPTYDLVLLLDPDAEEATRARIIADARAGIEADAELLRHDVWGHRALSYPIQRRTSAEYHLLQFKAGTAELLSRLNSSLRITDGVLRFRIIKLKPGVPEPPDMAGSAAASAGAGADSSSSAPPSGGGAPDASSGASPTAPNDAAAADSGAPTTGTAGEQQGAADAGRQQEAASTGEQPRAAGTGEQRAAGTAEPGASGAAEPRTSGAGEQQGASGTGEPRAAGAAEPGASAAVEHGERVQAGST
jgi:small subunit ribosomal protein S6